MNSRQSLSANRLFPTWLGKQVIYCYLYSSKQALSSELIEIFLENGGILSTIDERCAVVYWSSFAGVQIAVLRALNTANAIQTLYGGLLKDAGITIVFSCETANSDAGSMKNSRDMSLTERATISRSLSVTAEIARQCARHAIPMLMPILMTEAFSCHIGVPVNSKKIGHVTYSHDQVMAVYRLDHSPVSESLLSETLFPALLGPSTETLQVYQHYEVEEDRSCYRGPYIEVA